MDKAPAFEALVVDISRGVTRFALGIGAGEHDTRPVLGHYEKVQTADFSSIRELLDYYINLQGGMDKLPPILAISHAGPKIGEKIIIPGSALEFTIEELEQAYPFETIVTANDCVAMGSALPWLKESDVCSLAAGEQRAFTHQQGRYGLTVPTFHLGVASIIHTGSSIQVIDSEGGHANYAPCNIWHAEFLQHLQKSGFSPSCGDIVGQRGLERIYAYHTGRQSEHAPDLRAQEILLYARNEADPACLEAIRYFCQALGALAGDVALMLGAVDGMFLVSPFANEVMDLSPEMEKLVRDHFEAKTDFALYMKRIPLYKITHRRASMIGILRLACEKPGEAVAVAG